MSRGKAVALGCGGLLVLGAIATGVTVYVWADYPIAAMGWRAAEERARQAGVPLSQEELLEGREVPPEQNSASLYHRLFEEHIAALLDANEEMEDALRDPDLGPTEALRIAAGLSAPAQEFYQASRLPYYTLGLDLDMGGQLVFPQLSGFRQAAEFLSQRGLTYAKLGRVEDAVRDLSTSWRMARHVGQDGVLIHMATANAIYARTMSDTRRAAEALAGDPAGQARLRREVLGLGKVSTDIRRAILTEAYVTLAWTRNLDVLTDMHPAMAMLDQWAMVTDAEVNVLGHGLGPGFIPNPPERPLDQAKLRRSGAPPGWVLRGTMVRQLQGWAAFFEAVPESGATLEDFEEGFLRQAEALDNPKLSFAWARHTTFPEAPFRNLYLAPTVVQQKTEAYFAVLEYRNQQGRWPNTLAEAGVQAVDPFDGKPLRYRLEGEGFRIWSVGPDLRDDEGEVGRDPIAAFPNPPRVGPFRASL